MFKEIDSLQEISVADLFAMLEKKKPLRPGERYWFGISGSWKHTSGAVEQDVKKTVREILERGGGIVTGGALNVDYFATHEALQIDPKAEQIKVFLPVVLELYAAHYRKRAMEGVITIEQAEQLIDQLTKLKHANPAALIEHPENKIIDQRTYFERNTEVVQASDAVIGFQVNQSLGVADTLAKAVKRGKLVSRLAYEVAE